MLSADSGRTAPRHLLVACHEGRAGARAAAPAPPRVAAAVFQHAAAARRGLLAAQAVAVEEQVSGPAADKAGTEADAGNPKDGDALASLRSGDVAEGIYDGVWYKGEIVRINAEGTYTFKWDGYDKETDLWPYQIRKFSGDKRIPTSQLRLGQQIPGNVTKIMPYGAFVDIGATSAGLVHISKIVPGGLATASEVLSVGEEVVVRVTRVRADGAVELSMLKSDEEQISAAQVPVGKQFRGRVVKKVEYGVFVNVGLPRNGLVPTPLMKKGAEIGEGSEIDVWVSQFRNDGALELSMFPDGKPQMQVNVTTGRQLRGTVVKRVAYGIFVDVGFGKNALVPTANVKEDVEEIVTVGQEIDVWVSRVRSDGAVELSMFEVAEEQNYNVGDQLTGIVKTLVDYGAFVDVGAVKNGLVPMSKLGDEGIEDPSEILHVGQELQVWVSKVKDNGQMELTLVDPKALTNQGVPFSVGQRVEGAKVKTIVPYGAILEVEQFQGLLPRSKMSLPGSMPIASSIEVGQTLDVWVSALRRQGVLQFSTIEPAIEDTLEGFSRAMAKPEIMNGTWVRARWAQDTFWYLAQVKERIDDDTYNLYYEEIGTTGPCDREDIKLITEGGTPLAKLRYGSKLSGNVNTVFAWGAFVDVGAEVDGLVYKSRVAEEDVEDVRDVLKVGDEVDVWVAKRRFRAYSLELSMVESKLPPPQNRTVDIAEIPTDQWFPGKVVRIFDKSISVMAKFTNETAPRLGSIHISRISSTDYVKHPRDEVRIGQEVQVRLLKVDDKSRIQLTMLDPAEETTELERQVPGTGAAWSEEAKGDADKEEEEEDDYLI